MRQSTNYQIPVVQSSDPPNIELVGMGFDKVDEVIKTNVEALKDQINGINTGVKTLNGKTGDITLKTGDGISLDTNTMTISSTLATANKRGSVRVNTDGKYGLRMANEMIVVQSATQEDIDKRRNSSHTQREYRPITPIRLDEAVSAATHQDMSDSYNPSSFKKGSTQPVSYAAVKNYVDSKIVPVEPIVETNYKFINYTWREGYPEEIIIDLNGRYKKIFLQAKKTTTDGTSDITTIFSFVGENGGIIKYGIPMNTSPMRYAKMKVGREEGLWFGEGFGSTSTVLSTISPEYSFTMYGINNEIYQLTDSIINTTALGAKEAITQIKVRTTMSVASDYIEIVLYGIEDNSEIPTYYSITDNVNSPNFTLLTTNMYPGGTVWAKSSMGLTDTSDLIISNDNGEALPLNFIAINDNNYYLSEHIFCFTMPDSNVLITSGEQETDELYSYYAIDTTPSGNIVISAEVHEERPAGMALPGDSIFVNLSEDDIEYNFEEYKYYISLYDEREGTEYQQFEITEAGQWFEFTAIAAPMQIQVYREEKEEVMYTVRFVDESPSNKFDHITIDNIGLSWDVAPGSSVDFTFSMIPNGVNGGYAVAMGDFSGQEYYNGDGADSTPSFTMPEENVTVTLYDK